MNSKKTYIFFTMVIFLSFTLVSCFTTAQLRERRISQNQQLFDTFDQVDQDKIRRGELDVGFTEEMVRVAWGDPDRVSKRQSTTGASTVWSYTTIRTDWQRQRVQYPIVRLNARARHNSLYTDKWITYETQSEYTIGRVVFERGLVVSFESFETD